MNSKTILITGGHLTPALATIQLLSRTNHQIAFVGRTHTGDKHHRSHEQREVTRLGATWHHFDPPKFHRKPLSKNLGQISKLPATISSANRLLRQINPDLIVSFGGYLAPPIAYLARLSGIPIITHEQTFNLGLSNRLLTPIASTIALSWPSTPRPSAKFILTGNPLRQEFSTSLIRPKWINPRKPILFVTGGNQGSQAINQAILSNLDYLLTHFQVIHQIGNDFTSISSRTYRTQTWFEPADVAWLLAHADLTISRAGANTISEALVSQARCLLIPLPYSASKEQRTNAEFLIKHTASTMMDQSSLSQLPNFVTTALKRPKRKPTSQTQSLIKLHQNAATSLCQLITQKL